MEALFADGTSATGDVLIGADGIRSTVRTLIDPDAPGPEWTGMIGFEGHGIDPALIPSLDIEPGTACFAFGNRLPPLLPGRGPEGHLRLEPAVEGIPDHRAGPAGRRRAVDQDSAGDVRRRRSR